MKVEEPMTLSKMPLMMLPAVLLLLPPPSKPPNTPAIVEPVEVAEEAVEGVVDVAEVLVDAAVVAAVVVLDLVVLELVVFLVVVFLVDFLVVFFTGQLVISDKEVSFISVAKLPIAPASTRAAIKKTFFIPILYII